MFATEIDEPSIIKKGLNFQQSFKNFQLKKTP